MSIATLAEEPETAMMSYEQARTIALTLLGDRGCDSESDVAQAVDNAIIAVGAMLDCRSRSIVTPYCARSRARYAYGSAIS